VKAKRSPHHCKSIRNGTFDTSRLPGHRPLSPRSFQDALRAFFQPIKTEDSRLDFYTMYKREATEYDTDYVKKYDEDLNTTLIFVRRLSHTLSSIISLVHIGRFVLCRQLCFRHRCPFKTSARPQRTIRGPSPRNPPHSQSVRHPRRDPHSPTYSGRSTERDRHRNWAHVCEPPDLPARRIRRHAGEAMAEPIPAEFGRVDDRALRGPSAQMRWTREMAIALIR